MTTRTNEFNQPIGEEVPQWQAREKPQRIVLTGQYCQLVPVSHDQHLDDLYEAYTSAPDGRDWTYLFQAPPSDKTTFSQYLKNVETSQDPLAYTVIDLASQKAVGTLSLMRIDPTHGVIEVGGVTFSPKLKQTPLSTEAQFLLMQYAFDHLGYRRYEWKCDSLNAPSRKAALRLGFQFEGIFRQAIVYKGRSRDTAWFSIIDSEWPTVKAALAAWLAHANFDENGQQKQRLEAIRQSIASHT
ncbi:GNAT family N-acetyltransferase [Leeia sp. TBRC 13508]|uniref:GNAT family N-acetyltransferase n=1 Tax=Leeia speluncae TaxID=2884804 RepID=A0ABS8DA83_9NEIS|nr:GNAT family protein [Leeia speluncae]MCB6184518.1 GNAT family N-acetyltransferase [Leeia speluncae]